MNELNLPVGEAEAIPRQEGAEGEYRTRRLALARVLARAALRALMSPRHADCSERDVGPDGKASSGCGGE